MFAFYRKINIISNHFDISLDYLFSLSTKRKIVFDRKDLDYKLIGNRIKSIREKNNLTLRQLAKILNTSSSTISAYKQAKEDYLHHLHLIYAKDIMFQWIGCMVKLINNKRMDIINGFN